RLCVQWGERPVRRGRSRIADLGVRPDQGPPRRAGAGGRRGGRSQHRHLRLGERRATELRAPAGALAPPRRDRACADRSGEHADVRRRSRPGLRADRGRAGIDRLVTELWRERSSRARFEPGKSTVNYAGRVFDDAEIRALVRSSLDFWLTAGPETAAFERDLAAAAGTRYSHLVNSGSSA